MQIEQLQPPPIDDESRFGFAVPGFMDKESTGYRMFCLTDESRKLDKLFGMDPINSEEISEESSKKLQLATVFMGASHETTKVAFYFSELARIGNHFVALPPEEIYGATNGTITDSDIMRATEEGYIRRTIFSETYVELVELTAKFGWMFELSAELASDEMSFPTES